MKEILKINNAQSEKFLRRKTVPFDFGIYTKNEISDLIRNMRVTMDKARGVGLSANQIGLNFQVFVARVNKKFYAIFNPKIIKTAVFKKGMEEGCLSIPEEYDEVFRPDQIKLTGYNRNGKKIKIQARGILARVFQHEVDHLDGKLFIDHLKK